MSIHNIPKSVLVTLVLYSVATTVHFVHNAVFLDDYPNLPMWFTSGGVIGALMMIHVVGLLGLLAASFSKRTLGLVLLGVYAIIGFDGLAHYSVAAFSSHTLSMNLTILIEVATAFLLLLAVLVALVSHVQINRRLAQ